MLDLGKRSWFRWCQMKIVQILGIGLLAACLTAQGQSFDYDAYRAAALAHIVSGLPTHPADWLAEGETRFRTKVTFTGRFRPVSKTRQDYIASWVTTMGQPAGAASAFEREVEVEQGHTRYWMPIQEVLVGQLQKEVPAGATVEVYVLLMGTQADQPVFAVSEFDAESDVHAETEPAAAAEP
jgi:hypothetical protein